MTTETRICQSCKNGFIIEPADFAFYEKMHVPPPTFCPQCRMLRRFVWRVDRALYKRPDSRTGKLIFSAFRESSPLKVWENSDWQSDIWDPMTYARDYDWNRPFFAQMRALMVEVPWASRMSLNCVDSDYCADCGEFKNCYLAFTGSHCENVLYAVCPSHSRDSVDITEVRYSELCYEGFDCIKSYRVFFSSHIEESQDVWFSRDLVGCSNCFGCAGLRNKSYHMFNEPMSASAYKEKMRSFALGSYTYVEEMKKRANTVHLAFPVRYIRKMKSENFSGNYITNSRNVAHSFWIIDCENVKYCYRTSRSRDMMDFTTWGGGSELCYECTMTGRRNAGLKFCFYCLPDCRELEYCMNCHNCANCFGCVGLTNKQYCIFNRQYTKETFEELRAKIISHMSTHPFIDSHGRIYQYGEFFPPEFSPYAYNETIAHEYFPLTKNEAESNGYAWKDAVERNYAITLDANALPDHIRDVGPEIVSETIGCIHEAACNEECTRAYRIIPRELEFYQKIGIPLPRLCPNCRHYARLRQRNPLKLWKRSCMCVGGKSEARSTKSETTVEYINTATHRHGADHCLNEFETSYAPDRPEIVYCESCYNSEIA